LEEGTMGRSLIRRDPTKPLLIEDYDNVKQILEQIGWMEYVLCIQGYDVMTLLS